MVNSIDHDEKPKLASFSESATSTIEANKSTSTTSTSDSDVSSCKTKVKEKTQLSPNTAPLFPKIHNHQISPNDTKASGDKVNGHLKENDQVVKKDRDDANDLKIAKGKQTHGNMLFGPIIPSSFQSPISPTSNTKKTPINKSPTKKFNHSPMKLQLYQTSPFAKKASKHSPSKNNLELKTELQNKLHSPKPKSANIYTHEHNQPVDPLSIHEPNPNAKPGKSVLKRRFSTAFNDSQSQDPLNNLENPNISSNKISPSLENTDCSLEDASFFENTKEPKARRVQFNLPEYVPADDNSRIIYMREQREQMKRRKIQESLAARRDWFYNTPPGDSNSNNSVNKNDNNNNDTSIDSSKPFRRTLVAPTPIKLPRRNSDQQNYQNQSSSPSSKAQEREYLKNVFAKSKNTLHSHSNNSFFTSPICRRVQTFLNPSGHSLIPTSVFKSMLTKKSAENKVESKSESESELESKTSDASSVNDTNSSACNISVNRSVGYACNIKLIRLADKLPSNPGRATLVHTLIYAYKLFKPVSQTASNKTPDNSNPDTSGSLQCELVPVIPLSKEKLMEYHDKEYINFLFSLDENGNEMNSDDDDDHDSSDTETDSSFSSESHKIKRGADTQDFIPSKKQKMSDETRHTIPLSMKSQLANEKNSNDRKMVIKAHKKYEQFGLEYDCPYFEKVSEYVQYMTGASIACADYILNKVNEQKEHQQREEGSKQEIGSGSKSESPELSKPLAPVSINWQGGRHHARKSKAAGFCYANDVALCIQRLRTQFSKVLYIDLDLHHGDGVETAFTRSSKVAVVSVHRYGLGFYPGTENGSLEYKGGGASKSANAPGVGYTVNIPTLRGFSGASLERVFKEVIDPYATEVFKPDCVVVTVGCDGLARDEHREWNLTVDDYESVIKNYILNKWNLPTVFLGGGGYNHTDTARCWTYLTASMLGRTDQYEWDDIPEHSLLNSYKDDAYRFKIPQGVGKMEDQNKGEYLDNVINVLKERFKEMSK